MPQTAPSTPPAAPPPGLLFPHACPSLLKYPRPQACSLIDCRRRSLESLGDFYFFFYYYFLLLSTSSSRWEIRRCPVASHGDGSTACKRPSKQAKQNNGASDSLFRLRWRRWPRWRWKRETAVYPTALSGRETFMFPGGIVGWVFAVCRGAGGAAAVAVDANVESADRHHRQMGHFPRHLRAHHGLHHRRVLPRQVEAPKGPAAAGLPPSTSLLPAPIDEACAGSLTSSAVPGQSASAPAAVPERLAAGQLRLLPAQRVPDERHAPAPRLRPVPAARVLGPARGRLQDRPVAVEGRADEAAGRGEPGAGVRAARGSAASREVEQRQREASRGREGRELLVQDTVGPRSTRYWSRSLGIFVLLGGRMDIQVMRV